MSDVSDPPETTAVTFCATLLDEWVRAGVSDVVLAPGSRSTPMVLALAAEPRLRMHVHHDERSAGFVALGLGVATGRPAVVLTTSGTAAVELHPAVVEAHEARVPLIVCTADRPPELHGVGAPQTIDQQQLFGRSVCWFADPGVPDAATSSTWRPLAAEAYNRAVRGPGRPAGPVHCNLAFREPLVGEVGTLPPGRDGGRPWEQPVVQADALPVDSLDALAAGLAGRRGIIVAGAGIDDPAAVMALGRAAGWPVLADPRSGCRIPTESTISHADALLRVPEVADRLRPEVVLRLGALPASKVLGQWLAGLEVWQVAIEADGARFDPDRCLDALIAAEPGAAAAVLADHLPGGPVPDAPAGAESWAGAWAHADAVAAEAIASALAGQSEPCEPAVARDVVRALPEGSTLVVSSSMPVRDVEWFAVPRTGLRVLANRGANGIDGVLSTAVGVALAAPAASTGSGKAATAVLLGDVAFLYDANGLLGAASRGIDLTVVVVDNDGGGIFSFLPPAGFLPADVFERLYGTPHGVDLVGLAAAHGISSRVIDRQVDLAPAVEESAALGGVHVLIVCTDRAANVAIHDDLNAAVAQALAP